jgi:LysR family transcriptional regulator for metE and metH
VLPTASFDTRDLRLVRAIAEAGGVTRAARLLHLSQSAVSHQVKDLERRLGLTLFERRGRGVQMTEAATRLLALSHDVLESMARVESEIRRGARGASGTLRISTQCQTAYYWLPQVIGAFELHHPDVTLRIVPEATVDPATALVDGQIDLAFLIDRPKAAPFASIPLFEDELVAVLSPSHPLSRKPYVTGADMAGETLIIPDVPKSMRDHLQRKLWPEGPRPHRVMRVPLTEVIVELVKARQGISVLPMWSVSAPLMRGEVTAVRLTRHGLVRRWVAAYRRKSPLAEPIACLAELLRRPGRPSDTALVVAARRTSNGVSSSRR